MSDTSKSYTLDAEESLFHMRILKNWSPERIKRFCAHLMGDKYQQCLYDKVKESYQKENRDENFSEG